MQQYTFNIPNNIQAKELLNYILQTNIFRVNSVQEINSNNEVINDTTSIDFWDNLPASLKQSILKAKEQAKNGNVKSHKEITLKYSKWLSK